MTWHADSALLRRYAVGETDVATTMSIEAHLEACGACRQALAGDSRRLERVWARVVDTVDAPSLGPVERGLRRLGVPEETARLLAVTPSLRCSWLAGMGLVLTFAIFAARASEGRPYGLLAFLALAPLLPVAGVAVAFGPADPLSEVVAAAPIDHFRLLLVRSLAVLTSSVALGAVAAPLLPAEGWSAVAWLLPACALTAVSLALASRIPAPTASVTVATGWLVMVVAAWSQPPNRLALFGLAGQAGWVALLATGSLLVVVRRRCYDLGGQR